MNDKTFGKFYSKFDLRAHKKNSMRNSLLLAAFLLVSLTRCGGDKKEECAFIPDTEGKKVSIVLEQYQDSLVNVKSKDELVDLLTRQPMIRDYVFRRTEFENDSAFINAVYSRFNSPYMDTFLIETKRVFGDLSGLTSQFEEAFTNIKYYYPQFQPPKIQTVISGFATDLLVTDTLIIISLDYYLGKGAKYRPDIYEYLLRKYDPKDIVPSCLLMFGINARLNKTDLNDKTMLADMITYGKSFYFTKQMLPCVPDSVLISYTAEQVRGSRKNEALIWARFIEDQVLFSTDREMRRNYLDERPITIQVGEKCPGRIGQWMGWQIIQKYMQSHPEVTLQQLMDMRNAQQIFKESHYKPKA